MTSDANQIKSDTLTLLLTNMYWAGANVKTRALKIAKTCKIVRNRTKDKVLYGACNSIIKAVKAGDYEKACVAMNKTALNYEFFYLSKFAQS